MHVEIQLLKSRVKILNGLKQKKKQKKVNCKHFMPLALPQSNINFFFPKQLEMTANQVPKKKYNKIVQQKYNLTFQDTLSKLQLYIKFVPLLKQNQRFLVDWKLSRSIVFFFFAKIVQENQNLPLNQILFQISHLINFIMSSFSLTQ